MKGMTKYNINAFVEGQRVRQYIYIEKSDKTWLKLKAKELGVSVSRYLTNLIQQEIENEQTLDLDLK